MTTPYHYHANHKHELHPQLRPDSLRDRHLRVRMAEDRRALLVVAWCALGALLTILLIGLAWRDGHAGQGFGKAGLQIQGRAAHTGRVAQ